jgi:anaerobic selenocysteine-containing dehydrogenase
VDQGVSHSVQGTETVTLLSTLCVLTGNLSRPGAAPFSITDQCSDGHPQAASPPPCPATGLT